MGEQAARTGGHLQGNFPKYYAFHPTTDRLQPMLQSKQALEIILAASKGSKRHCCTISDWGCNTGEMTVELYKEMVLCLHPKQQEQQVAILGMDVDASLIERAKASLTKEEGSQEGERIQFEAIDLFKEQERANVIMQTFLKKHQHEEKGYNVESERFDLITIFSTTMWIHLVYGEDALKAFLTFVASKCHCLIIEPQDYYSYKSALRRLRRMHLTPSSYFQEVSPSMRNYGISETIAEYLLGINGGFTYVLNLGKTSSWERDLMFFWREEKKEGKEEEKEAEGDEGKKKKRT